MKKIIAFSCFVILFLSLANPAMSTETEIVVADEIITVKADAADIAEYKEIRAEEAAQNQLSNATLIGDFEATAYDLSLQCCGKLSDHPAYGITANGTNIIGQSRKEARTIAVDPNVIPLGSKVYIEFSGEYQDFSGVYVANDTGSAVEQNIVDIFMGDYNSEEASQEAIEFGRQNVKVYVVG